MEIELLICFLITAKRKLQSKNTQIMISHYPVLQINIANWVTIDQYIPKSTLYTSKQIEIRRCVTLAYWNEYKTEI